MSRRRVFEWVSIVLVALVAGRTAVWLQYLWQPDDAGATGHATAVRFAGLVLAACVVAAAGHRRLFCLPALATYGIAALLGHRLDLSGDVAETTAAHMAIELTLVLLPAAVLAWLRRDEPSSPLPSVVAVLVGGGLAAVLIGSAVVAAGPYPEAVETTAGQAVAVALVTALIAAKPRLVWAAAALPVLLWHEPLVDVLYYAKSSYGPPAGEYYGLAVRGLLVGISVPAVEAALRLVRRARPSVPAT